MILLDPLLIRCLFRILLLILCSLFSLLLYEFELEYCALLVGILRLYQYMQVVFLCLFFCKLSILYLCGSLLHRSFHSCLNVTAIFHIYYAYRSMFLVSLLACLWLSWTVVQAFSESVSIASSCGYLVSLDGVS